MASNKKSPIVGKLTYGKQIGQSIICDKVPDETDSIKELKRSRYKFKNW